MGALAVAAVVAIVILLIALVVGKRYARRVQRADKIRVDRFKLKKRHAHIELEVFGTREVVQAIEQYAKEHHVSIETARRQAATYLREIVPKFNILAYYRFGAPIARAIMYFLYRPVVERNPLHEFNERAPRGSVVVYAINHRSNADYVLVAHMLFKFISLSYAIGEWARVWPLNHLFKWFGGYFVRRRYREQLYHAILSSFVQTITKNGVTQGIFLEGGLTRDGAFLKPKLGMLGYIVTAKRDPTFTAPLYVIPTAVNYDRVLEDRNLTEELLGKEDRSTRGEKLRTTFDFLFRNFFRSLAGGFKRYGYAMVTFGAPIDIDRFVREHPDVLSHSFAERKPELERLAERVMSEISRAVPVTPVTLVATVLRDQKVLAEPEILGEISRLREAWNDRIWLLREKTSEELWRAARDVLMLRHLLVEEAGCWRWAPEERLLCDYYANSLLSFEEVKRRGWPERSDRKEEHG